MRYILIIFIFNFVFLHADESVKNKIKTNISFVGTNDAKTKLAKDMIETIMTDRFLKKVQLKNVILFQGQERTYSRPFYKIINDNFLSTLQKLDIFKVQYQDKTPRLKIIGTPTSLKISKEKSQKMDDLAKASGSDGVFVWDIFEYDGNMQLLIRVIKVENHEVLWSYQLNEEELVKSETLKKEFKKQYIIPRKSDIIVSTNFSYNKSTYTKRTSSDSSTDSTNWLTEFNILYTTTSQISPAINFGLSYTYSTLTAGKFPLNYNSILIDFRFQLNDYVDPVYDLKTGEVFMNRNKQLFSIGLAFGPTIMNSTDSSSSQVYGTIKAYLNAGISHNLEFNIGLSLSRQKNLATRNDQSYKNNNITANRLTLYAGVGYKFNLDKD